MQLKNRPGAGQYSTDAILGSLCPAPMGCFDPVLVFALYLCLVAGSKQPLRWVVFYPRSQDTQFSGSGGPKALRWGLDLGSASAPGGSTGASVAPLSLLYSHFAPWDLFTIITQMSQNERSNDL